MIIATAPPKVEKPKIKEGPELRFEDVALNILTKSGQEKANMPIVGNINIIEKSNDPKTSSSGEMYSIMAL